VRAPSAWFRAAQRPPFTGLIATINLSARHPRETRPFSRGFHTKVLTHPAGVRV
jgi:hypothetical protein